MPSLYFKVLYDEEVDDPEENHEGGAPYSGDLIANLIDGPTWMEDAPPGYSGQRQGCYVSVENWNQVINILVGMGLHPVTQ